MTPFSPGAARRVYLGLTVSRWFPVGLVVAAVTLLPIDRGLTVTETLTLASVTGAVVFALELPTGGFADALGRRPVLLAAAAAQVLAAALYVVADSVVIFMVAAAAMGVFRALDSGPLEAWFVDTVHATSPGADVDRTLAHQGAVLGGSVATGALVSGGLVWWYPVQAWSSMMLPFVVYAVLAAGHLVAVAVLLREPARVTAQDRSRLRDAAAAARQAPQTAVHGLRLAGGNGVLGSLLALEACGSVAMVVMESFQPIRLAEILGSEHEAGALMGPVASVGWAVFAGGAALGGIMARRIGVARAAMVARVCHGLGCVWMGLVAGPGALVAVYLITYGWHGAGGPLVHALLHRESSSATRATVLSMASMCAFAAYAVASPVLGWAADATSTQLAMVLGGAVSIGACGSFRPALRRERELRAAEPETVRI